MFDIKKYFEESSKTISNLYSFEKELISISPLSGSIMKIVFDRLWSPRTEKDLFFCLTQVNDYFQIYTSYSKLSDTLYAFYSSQD